MENARNRQVFSLREGRKVTFSREAMQFFLEFATSKKAKWLANFRDLNAAIIRMATLAPGGRIGMDLVQEEVERLRVSWSGGTGGASRNLAAETLGAKAADALDLFDRCQLETVIRVYREAKHLSDAGRALFSETRKTKAAPNDADRLRKYLARFGLEWSGLASEP